MEPPEHTRAPGAVLEQCPHCRGAVRSDAPWCTQCWTDLRPAPPPVEPPPVEPPVEPHPVGPPPVAGVGPQPPAPGAPPAPGGKGWPCATCGHVNAVEDDACAACGTSLFASLKSGEEPLLVLPGVGDLTRYSRAQRLGMAAGVVVVVCLLVLLVGALLG